MSVRREALIIGQLEVPVRNYIGAIADNYRLERPLFFQSAHTALLHMNTDTSGAIFVPASEQLDEAQSIRSLVRGFFRNPAEPDPEELAKAELSYREQLLHTAHDLKIPTGWLSAATSLAYDPSKIVVRETPETVSCPAPHIGAWLMKQGSPKLSLVPKSVARPNNRVA